MRNTKGASYPGKLAALLAGAALLGLTTQSALALTPSNTSISNLATLSYSVSGVLQPVLESSALGNTTPGLGNGSATTFVVDKKINLTVAEVDATFHATVPGQLASSGLNAMHYTVTNTGNDPQDFSLATSQPAGGTLFGGTDSYDSAACTAFIDANANGIKDAGEATFIDELAAGASQTVTITCDTPALLVNGDVSIVALIATVLVGGGAGVQGGALPADAGATANTAVVDIVYADPIGTDDVVHDAKHSARDAFRVGTASITVTKTATLLCDPVSGTGTPHYIPGATVKYVISIANAAASAPATLATISDVIDANSTFEPNLVTAASSCVTPESAAASGFKVGVTASTRAGFPKYFTTAADADAVGITGATITAAIATALPVEAGYAAGELKAGETLTLTFNVTIN